MKGKMEISCKQICKARFPISNSLIIHKEKTKEINTVMVVWNFGYQILISIKFANFCFEFLQEL